jgi:hypothetical protein
MPGERSMKSRNTRAAAAHRQVAPAAAPRTEAATAQAMPAAARDRCDAPRLDVGRTPRVQAQRRTIQAVFGPAVRRAP